MDFGDWVLSLPMMFSRFTHVILYICTLSFLIANYIPLYRHTIFCLYIHQLIDIWFVSVFIFINNAVNKYLCSSTLRGTLSIKKKQILPLVKIWMKLAGTMLSEMSQTVKDK